MCQLQKCESENIMKMNFRRADFIKLKEEMGKGTVGGRIHANQVTS